MLATTEKSAYQIPKLEGRIKTKTIILGTSLVLGLLFYSQSTKPAKIVEISTNTQSPSYTKWIEKLADNYQLFAQQQIKTPGNSCFKSTVTDCLEQLKPDKPRRFESLEPAKAISSNMRQLGYQARLDAINLAQEKLKK